MNKNIRLDYYFWELPKPEATGQWWGQIAGCFHRLYFIKEELEKLSNKKDLQTLITGLSYHLENYFYRIYELRERVIGFLISVTKDNEPEKLKNFKLRNGVLIKLKKDLPDLSNCVEQFLLETDTAIKVRNRHTHNQFLSIGISMANQDIFDIEDLIDELEPINDTKKKTIIKNIKKVTITFRDEYCNSIDRICGITKEFLHNADKYC